MLHLQESSDVFRCKVSVVEVFHFLQHFTPQLAVQIDSDHMKVIAGPSNKITESCFCDCKLEVAVMGILKLGLFINKFKAKAIIFASIH